MGETTPAGVKELGYATFGAGQVTWQREGELLLITVREPVGPARRVNWWRLAAGWLVLFVAVVIGVGIVNGPGPGITSTGIGMAMLMVVGMLVMLLSGLATGPRTLSVRVSAKKLLIDESTLRWRWITEGVSVSGRAWEKAEIVSVKANGGSLNVKTKTRRLASLSISGYDPGDMAWLAEVIGKVLEGGAEAWERSQQGNLVRG